MIGHRSPRRLAGLSLIAALTGLTVSSAQQVEPNRGGTIDLSSRDPRIALQRIKPAAGYEVNLFASEEQFPELGKPLAMTFDARGRLWVLTSPTYPHLLPGKTPTDKLVILDDTNEDGRADKLTVFAENLHLPMGFALGDGGVYVSQQPNLMFIQDTNGDDRADERRIILHGFGTEDSHHAMHAFTWGPGGSLYFQEGTFLHSQVETPYGPVRVENAAVFEYDPKTERLGVFASYPYANPWGHVFDRWGQNFISDASNGNNHYGTAYSGHVDYPRKQRTIKEWTLTKVRPTSGIEFVSSRHFPDEAQGNFLINNVIGFHGTKQYRVVEDGSGFVGIEVEPLLQSTDSNFRPVALQFGPDGALYVVDWFNPLIGHMQYSIRDPGRDTVHGRVWRVTAKGRPLLQRPRIAGEPIEKQLDLLKAYEDRTRYLARLALRAQPTERVTSALRAWVGALNPADPQLEHHLLEALWVYQHHGVVERDLLVRLLRAKEFRARAAAVRVLQHWFDKIGDGIDLLAPMAGDAAPRVRLEAVRALSFVPTVKATDAALRLLEQPTDYYLQYALDSAITTLEPAWKPALTAGQPIAANNPDGLAYLLARLQPVDLTALPRSVPVYHALLRRADVDAKYRQEALIGLAKSSGQSVLQELLAAIDRVDGIPGGRAPSADLIRLLFSPAVGSLSAARADLQRLASSGRTDVVRQGGWAAIMTADGSVDQAWTRASASARGRIDLLDSIPLLSSPDLRRALYPHVSSLLVGDSTSSKTPVVPLLGRYVRVLLPGRNRTLGLAEVEVASGGQNVARGATATQSSTIPGGDFGGSADRAIDGRSDRSKAGAEAAFTTEEQDPWWEVDLGADKPVDTLVVRPYVVDGESEDARLHVSVLNAAHETVFAADGLALGAPSHSISVGGDLSAAVTAAAMSALPLLPGHESDAFGLLAAAVKSGSNKSTAIEALRTIPTERWPASDLAPLAHSLVAYARQVPPAERTGDEFRHAVAFGRELATRLPPTEATAVTSALDALAVRTIRIQALLAQMKFDVDQFAVVPGEEIEIVFVNGDEMPHNLLITAPGKLEDVGLKAEAMASQPDGFQRHFVPDTPDVLQHTKLIGHQEIARLRFTAPTAKGRYPYVCTFPGHWRTMNGVMDVATPPSTSQAAR